MQKKITDALSFFVLLLLFSVSLFSIFGIRQSLSTPALIIVPDNYATIQAAINAANEGDTIVVKPGIYKERLLVNKPLTLLGSGSLTVIQGDGNGHTVDIPRGTINVTFTGFVIDGTGRPPWAGINIRGRYTNISNNAVLNHYYGIYMWDSSGNILRNNNLTGNRFNLKVWGLTIEQFLHDIDTTNTVNGKPVYYWINQQNKIVPRDAGYVAVVNSSNITVKDISLSNNFPGALFAYTNHSVVSNLYVSKNEEGIRAIHSGNNVFVNNNIFDNEYGGFSLIASSNNVIAENTIESNRWGIALAFDFLVTPPQQSSNNSVHGNVLSSNYEGVWIDRSSSNTFHHNSFINNTVQVSVSKSSPPSVNKWDDGYPSGGNYWSNYSGTDLNQGPAQNQTGSDGIGDTPHIIDENNRDQYPLVNPWAPNPKEVHDVAVVSVVPSVDEVYVNQVLNIIVRVRNEGNVTETFSVVCEYELDGVKHTIGTILVTSLESNTDTTLTFSWETTNIGVHIIKAQIPNLADETDTDDNILTSPIMVKVKIIGDVNGDNQVDIRDIAQAGLAFGSYSDHPRWNSQADINQDNKIDIRDLAVIAKSFGKTYP